MARFRPHSSLFRPAALAAALTPILLSACAESTYPSLAPRAEERIVEPAPPPALPPLEDLDPTLRTRLRAALDKAGTASAAFPANRAEAEERLRAAEAHRGEAEAWFPANIALAQLQATHGTVSSALGEVDELYIEDRVRHAEVDSRIGDAQARPAGQALAAARGQILAWSEAEERDIAALEARLARLPLPAGAVPKRETAQP